MININIFGRSKIVLTAMLFMTTVSTFGVEMGISSDGVMSKAEELVGEDPKEPPATKPTILNLMKSEELLMAQEQKYASQKRTEEQNKKKKQEEEKLKAEAKKKEDQKAIEAQKTKQQKPVKPVTTKEKQPTQSKSGKGRLLGTFEATAYTDNQSSQGEWVGQTATGREPQVGVIAVDPNIIPLNSKLYVEGYNGGQVVIAGDTGGAIKGHIVDLFLNSESECRSWGRRHVKIWIID